MSTHSTSGGCRHCWFAVDLLVTLLVLGLIGAAWWWTHRQPDMVAVLHANNRGVAHMERYEYEKAVADFEECVKMAPNWRPGQINLGIALLNTASEENLQRAITLFRAILKEDPDDPYAHYCLGIILQYKKHPDEVAPHFEAVTRIDPNDAGAWFNLGKSLPPDSQRAKECYQRAVELDPYLTAALNNLGLAYMRTDRDKGQELIDRMEALRQAKWIDPMDLKYGSMGRYANVIGAPARSGPPRTGPLPVFQPLEGLQVELAPGTRWASAKDFGDDAVGRLRARARERFGATLVVLDYDGDGLLDLFLIGAVVEKGKVRDLLLRNLGERKFRDVTAAAGLAESRPSLGCCVADIDNDGRPDLLITGAGQQKLFRNTGHGGFEDVTARAGLDKLTTICLGACFLDLDHDGDLDLVVCLYGSDAEAALQKDAPEKGPGLAIWLNVGEAPAGKEQAPLPLEVKFQRWQEAPFRDAGPAVGIAAADFDRDDDLDLLVLFDGKAPAVAVNDRLLKFHTATLPDALAGARRWNGALVLDVNGDGRSDALLIGPDKRPALLLARSVRGQTEVSKWFESGATNSPPLLQAQAIDIDLDGRTDVIGLSADRRPVLLHNDGTRLELAPEALGADPAWPADVVAVAAAPILNSSFADLIVWSESKGLQLHTNRGNGNFGVRLTVTGRRNPGRDQRCNADGIGVWITAQAGDLVTGLENTTLSAGLGQSRQPLVLGLGRYAEADALRLRWPDGILQAEMNVPTTEVFSITQTARKPDSCPILFTWNSKRFVFITDFLGAGSVGELQPDGSTRPPRPEESVKIEAEQLRPLNGQYVLKIAEPMNEVTYLDRLQLVVLDHPAEMLVYPDERFVSSGPPASQVLLPFQQQVFPVRATDHRGRDVTATLRHWDRDTVDDFARRSWLGFAEEHWVELDFGDRLAQFGPQDQLWLCIAGWTDYPYPDSIWAATQAGVAVREPCLERLGPDGKWHTLITEAGFPAGLPRMTTLEVSGKVAGPTCKLRLRTNMTVFWDQVFVASLKEKGGTQVKARIPTVTTLEVSAASLAPCIDMQEFSPDGREPTQYDYDRRASQPVVKPSGRWTRHGDVTPLLRQADDCFVIFGPGDELTVRFDASKLPELPSGWKRSFVLRTWGYCKDCSPFTATGATVEPLPFRGMKRYPYGPEESYPRDPVHEEYRRRYNTRQVGPQRR